MALKIGVLCPSEIAFRRFLPAVLKSDKFEYFGVAHASSLEWNGTPDDSVINAECEKAERFKEAYGGEVLHSYEELLDSDVDAVYIPLPPALHYEWAERALKKGKHVLCEKPCTDSLSKTEALISLAKEKNLALYENYMFIYHSQIQQMIDEIEKKEIGGVRLYRIAFGFPFRSAADFRYKKALGGGALLDCGGYTLKLASLLLGETARVVCAGLNYTDDFDVDLYGSATMVNEAGVTAQLSFGMDNEYKCELEVWGSKGTLYTGRIFTAPAGFAPQLTKRIGGRDELIPLEEDDTFMKSINCFGSCIEDPAVRGDIYCQIKRQSGLVDDVFRLAAK